MKAIYITGFMGTGKTTIGKALSTSMNIPVIDTDQWIEEMVGKSVSDIFSDDGEHVFREYERKCLTLLPKDHIIITTGGGIVIQEENRLLMKKWGIVVNLQCDTKEIFERLKMDQTRPLLTKDKQRNIEKLLKERHAFYQEADLIVDTSQNNIEQAVSQIVQLIKSFDMR